MHAITPRASSLASPPPLDRRTFAPLLGVALLIAAMVAACSQAGAAGDPGVASLQSPGTTQPSPSASVDPQQAFLDYAKCMREHGIDMPDPQVDSGSGKVTMSIGSGSGPIDKDKMTTAQTACQHFIANARLGGDQKLSPEEQDKILAFARCMREHGVDMPDPDFSNGGGFVQVGGPGSKDTLDPGGEKFQAAQQACDSLLPGVGPRTTTGGSGPDNGGSSTDSNAGGTDSGPTLEVQP